MLMSVPEVGCNRRYSYSRTGSVKGSFVGAGDRSACDRNRAMPTGSTSSFPPRGMTKRVLWSEAWPFASPEKGAAGTLPAGNAGGCRHGRCPRGAQARLAAILAADVVSYARLVEQDEAATLDAGGDGLGRQAVWLVLANERRRVATLPYDEPVLMAPPPVRKAVARSRSASGSGTPCGTAGGSGRRQ
jgi:hypothetical protein